jgi:hypothetical protein
MSSKFAAEIVHQHDLEMLFSHAGNLEWEGKHVSISSDPFAASEPIKRLIFCLFLQKISAGFPSGQGKIQSFCW